MPPSTLRRGHGKPLAHPRLQHRFCPTRTPLVPISYIGHAAFDAPWSWTRQSPWLIQGPNIASALLVLRWYQSPTLTQGGLGGDGGFAVFVASAACDT
jgi:hypothetical protein